MKYLLYTLSACAGLTITCTMTTCQQELARHPRPISVSSEGQNFRNAPFAADFNDAAAIAREIPPVQRSRSLSQLADQYGDVIDNIHDQLDRKERASARKIEHRPRLSKKEIVERIHASKEADLQAELQATRQTERSVAKLERAVNSAIVHTLESRGLDPKSVNVHVEYTYTQQQ